MFIISLTYQVPLVEIDAKLDAHRAFLDRYFAKGTFLASGPKIPRTGGVILATAPGCQEIERILAEDPFQTNGLASYTVEEFQPTRFADRASDVLRQWLIPKN